MVCIFPNDRAVIRLVGAILAEQNDEWVCAGKGGAVQRVKVSHGEGVAIRTDPELCGASRKIGNEALVGACAGRVLSPEISRSGVPTQSIHAEGHTLPIDNARWVGTPRGRRPRASTEAPRTQTGRSQDFSRDHLGRNLERSGKSKDRRR